MEPDSLDSGTLKSISTLPGKFCGDLTSSEATALLNADTDPSERVGMAIICDESISGFPEDDNPPKGGALEMLKVVNLLKDAGITCCMVDKPALVYYGAPRVWFEWCVCVPTDQVSHAAEILLAQSNEIIPFRPAAWKHVRTLNHLYPRFKFIGKVIFISIVPEQLYHISCKPESIEHGKSGLPFPKLPVLVQSLIETLNLVDLDDLVDGMNLTKEWGESNLNLEGLTDTGYAHWRHNAHAGDPNSLPPPFLCRDGRNKRDLWEQIVTPEAKKGRQGHKYEPMFETRFWRKGQKDPRQRGNW